ncbi:MAG: hypothetical protein IKP88_13855 [Lachnospiraceae bacterium]|nr:hypothetical protein [Lachnospiraceae bacterium]
MEIFKREINNTVRRMENGSERVEGFVFITWVDSAGRILGFQIMDEYEDDGFCVRYANNGSKFEAQAYLLNNGDPYVDIFSVSGNLSGADLSGTLTIPADDFGRDYSELVIEFKDLNILNLINGEINMKIVGSPADFLNNMYALYMIGDWELKDCNRCLDETELSEAQIEIAINMSADKWEFNASASDKTEKLVSTTIKIENGSAGDIDIPDSTTSVNSGSRFEAFWNKMDWSIFRNKLKDAEAPEDVFEVDWSDIEDIERFFERINRTYSSY